MKKYDEKGNLIYNKQNEFEEWWVYDENNNCINYKNSGGFEEEYEYDINNNMIHSKDYTGLEI